MTSTLIAQNNRHRQVTLCIPLAARSAGLTARPAGPEGPEGLGTWGLIPQWMAMDGQDEPLFNVDVGGFWWF